MEDTTTVKALTPIRYSVDGTEVKSYEPGDTFEVLVIHLKQLHEAGAVEVSDEVAAQLETVPPTDPETVGAPTTVPADQAGVPVHNDGVPSEGTNSPLPDAPVAQPQSSQPSAEDISQTLDSLQ